MPCWLIKSAIHRTISLLPRSQQCNEWFQKNVTKSLGLSNGAFERRLDLARQILDDFLRLHPEAGREFTALELGTGWHPIVPVALFLCGASEIWSFDICPLLNRERLSMVLNHFCEHDRNGKLSQLLPRLRTERMASVREAFAQLESATPESVLAKLDIHALVRDAQDTGLKPNSIDLFFSCAVLEYIPGAIQAGFFKEFHRLATPRGVMVHFVDLKDEYSSFDHAITQLNFYRYSDAAWKWLNSPLISQTRLRPPDYYKLLNDAGFEVVKDQRLNAAPDTLKKVPLAPEFQKYKSEDLLAIEMWLVAKPKR